MPPMLFPAKAGFQGTSAWKGRFDPKGTKMRATVQFARNEVTRPMGTVEHRTGWKWHTPRDAGDERVRPAPELARIGTRLRAFYQQVEEEDVPDRLLKLLKRLERAS
jgi:hypothetical protein